MQVEDLLRAVPSGQLYGPEIKGKITQLVNDTRNLVVVPLLLLRAYNLTVTLL